MLPVPIRNASSGSPWMERLVNAAPSQMPGQMRGPTSNTAVRAMPDGGHTAVA